MKNNVLLTFSLHGLILAVDADAVRQVLWLPELTMIEECPPYIAGVVNMHGKLLPIVDLNIRFGHTPRPYNCSDKLIILDVSALRTPHSSLTSFGIIVNDVLDVIDVPEEDIELPPFETIETGTHPHFVKGVAKSDQNIIMILNLMTMMDSEFEISPAEIDTFEPAETVSTATKAATGYFFPGADPGERDLFHSRATDLKAVLDCDDNSKVLPAAVFTLNNEQICVELESVREFAKIHKITPIPCCPAHISGNMNLRGNVLTLIDIRTLLNMHGAGATESSRIVVTDIGEFPVGIVADDIIDVISLREMDIIRVPSTINARDNKFVKGVVPYGDRMMTLLDLKEILAWEGLIVNEEV